MEEGWQVQYDDFSGPCRARAGEELSLNHKFAWNGDTWVALSVYICGKGLVLDIGKCVEPDAMRAFVDKWKSYEDRDDLPQAVENQIFEENPVNVDLMPELFLNGKTLKWSGSSGINYMPSNLLAKPEEKVTYEPILEDGMEDTPIDNTSANDVTDDEADARIRHYDLGEADAWVRHYNLDTSKAWAFHRINFAWATMRKPKIASMQLRLKTGPHRVYGEPFGPLKPGESAELVNPKTLEQYKLTVLDLKPIEVPEFPVTMRKMKYPRCCMQMNYTVEPEIAQEKLLLNDCAEGDRPVVKEDKFVTSVSVIGGADGPTSVFLAGKMDRKEEGQIACSALHFQPVEDVVWQPIFSVDKDEEVVVELQFARC